jgi:hypothetical protein
MAARRARAVSVMAVIARASWAADALQVTLGT